MNRMKYLAEKVLIGGCLAASLIILIGCNNNAALDEDCDEGDIHACQALVPPSEPAPVTVEVGSTATFFVYAVTGDSYQWYIGKSKTIVGSNFTAISGATNDTLKYFDAQLSLDSSYVYCAVKGSVITNYGPALLHVIPDTT